jgi:prepilin-type N-terminal cleavage/methylation domain-containing protein
MNKSFTLIEILVVIVVIGIISSFIIIGLSSVSDKANIAKGQAFSNSLRNSLLMNIISEWKFDGNANDSWSTNNGTVSGATLISSNCVKGSCYSFDGVDDYIELADNPKLRMATGGTISVWVYPKALGGASAGRIIDKSTATNALDGYFIFCGGTNTFGFRTNGENPYLLSLDNSVIFSKWQLVTITFNNSGRNIYINGINVTSSGSSLTALPPNISGVVAIGNRATATDRTFNGYIDEIILYDAVMSSFKIQEEYYSGLINIFNNNLIKNQDYKKSLVDFKKELVKDF